MPRKKTPPPTKAAKTRAKLNDAPNIGGGMELDMTSTGLWGLDWALQGGLAIHSNTMIYGATGIGKTTLAAYLSGRMSSVHGGNIAFMDIETNDRNTLYRYMAAGGFTGRLEIESNRDDKHKPIGHEKMAQNLIDRLQTADYPIVLLDSISAMVSSRELENEIGKSNMGVQALINAQILRRAMARHNLAEHATFFMYVNHQRPNVGGGFAGMHPPGGEAVKDYSQVILKVWREKEHEWGDFVIAGKAEKNRFAQRSREFSAYVRGGWGVSIGMTAVWDAIAVGLATNDRIVKLGGKSFGSLRKLAQSDDPEAYQPFVDALQEYQPSDVQSTSEESDAS